MTNITNDIVAKLWNLCNVLKDDGITYHQYVTELTFLLFLKMAKETGTEEQIQTGHRWDDLKAIPKLERLDAYKETLLFLGLHGNTIIKQIFKDSNTYIKKSITFSTLFDGIDKLAWYSAKREDLGNIYEGLLEKNANEKKSGAGQYFTARALIDSMVAVMQPRLEDVIQDPAAGTGGFLIAANNYIVERNPSSNWTVSQQKKHRTSTFFGMEHVHDTHRLALMNLLLHGIDSDPNASGIRYGDTLSSDGEALPKSTLILSNPPFGTKKGGGLPSRKFKYPTSNKQFCFLQHIYQNLKPEGRAAVILPDNALFEGNIGKNIRTDLMDKCNLHTILRLPTGIFYAQGVKTCVLFFTRGKSDRNNTKNVWVYDLRSSMPQYGKRTILNRAHFLEFEAAFGSDPLGKADSLAQRIDTGEDGRFRQFSREWIAKRNDSLDISWLKEEDKDETGLIPEPTILAREAMSELEFAMKDLHKIMIELGEAK